MEVDRFNFSEKLDLLTDVIRDCTFVSLDGEFTGLNQGKLYTPNSFDTPEERYQKLRKGSMDFLLVQFGLCAFTFDEENKRYRAHPYSFYVFPRPSGRHTPDIRFSCQSSSIDFLCNQDFDFNKVFKKGIPYLLPADEQSYRDSLEQMFPSQPAPLGEGEEAQSPAFTSPPAQKAKPRVPVPDEHKEFCQNLCQKVEDFLKDETAQSLQLEPCNGFLRLLTYQEVKAKFETGISLETTKYFETTEDGKKKATRFKCIVVHKADCDQKRERELNKQKTYQDELEAAVGFSKVIRLLASSGKLLVGHNMLLDLLHTLHQFISPLPETLGELKILSTSVFPRVVDTKLMASNQPFKDLIAYTSLEELHKSLGGPPFAKSDTEFADGCPTYTLETEKFHDAAYDAYVTGQCFIAMARHLEGSLKPPPSPTPANASPPSSSPAIQPFINKIYLMRSHDIQYLNLQGEDLRPSREHVFHLSFPREWRASDLSQLFAPFGSVYIGWLDDTSAFVALNKKEMANQVLKKLKQDAPVFRIQSYSSFKKAQASGQAAAAAVKRKAPQEQRDSGDGSSGGGPSAKKAKPHHSGHSPPTTPTRATPPHQDLTPAPDIQQQQEGADPASRPSGTDQDLSDKKMFEEPDCW